MSFPIKQSVLAEEIGFFPGNSYVWLAGSEVVAFGQIIDKAGNRKHLARIVTNPESRGQGYGALLCHALISIAEKSADEITLNVYRANSIALTLYRDLGFVEEPGKSSGDTLFMVKRHEVSSTTPTT